MSNYRRLRIPGSTWYFTVNLADRGDTALVDHIDTLRAAYRATALEQPIQCDAMVVLPNHLHAVWTLPDGDSDFSNRWRKIKARFTHATGLQGIQTHSKLEKREAGLWQRRFWEHRIRDADEKDRAIAYCLADPVRHGLVTDPADWAFSTLHRDLRAQALGKVGESPTLQAAARRVGNLPTFLSSSPRPLPAPLPRPAPS